jgi:hypothetical protein
VEATPFQKPIAELERKLAKAEQVIDFRAIVHALPRACARQSADGLDLPAPEQAIPDVSAVVGERQACKKLGVPRASLQVFDDVKCFCQSVSRT